MDLLLLKIQPYFDFLNFFKIFFPSSLKHCLAPGESTLGLDGGLCVLPSSLGRKLREPAGTVSPSSNAWATRKSTPKAWNPEAFSAENSRDSFQNGYLNKAFWIELHWLLESAVIFNHRPPRHYKAADNSISSTPLVPNFSHLDTSAV